MKSTIIAIGLTAVSMASVGFIGGIYAMAYKTPEQLALEACGVKYNVNRCEFVAMPAGPKKEPEKVYIKQDLLPPPSGMGS